MFKKNKNNCNLSAEKHFDLGIMRSKWQLGGQTLKLLILFRVNFYRHVHITRPLSYQDKQKNLEKLPTQLHYIFIFL